MWGKKKEQWSSVVNSIQGDVTIPESVFMIGSELNGKIRIGENCRIKNAVLYGEIEIGRYSSLWGPNVDIHAKLNKVTIGSFCSIARNTTMQEYNHITDRLSTYFVFQNLFKDEKGMLKDIESKGMINIGHDVWVGAQCVILSGAKIGNGAVIAANSVVSGEIPPYAIVGGSPAKVIKYRFSHDIIDKLNELNWWNWSIEKINANRSLFEGGLTIDKLNKIS